METLSRLDMSQYVQHVLTFGIMHSGNEIFLVVFSVILCVTGDENSAVEQSFMHQCTAFEIHGIYIIPHGS
jgi:hypothetical protein